MLTVYPRAVMRSSVWRQCQGGAPPATTDANEPQPPPPERTHLGCRGVAAGLSESLAEGSRRTISLQMSGGPQGSRTPDLRRATTHHSSAAGTSDAIRVDRPPGPRLYGNQAGRLPAPRTCAAAGVAGSTIQSRPRSTELPNALRV